MRVYPVSAHALLPSPVLRLRLALPYEIKSNSRTGAHEKRVGDPTISPDIADRLLKSRYGPDGADLGCSENQIRLPRPLPSQAEHSRVTHMTTPVEEPNDLQRPIRGEVAMWRSVILQCLTDAMSESKKPEMRYERAQARVWLEGRNPDFTQVCHYAQLDPCYVRERCKAAIVRHDRNLSHTKS